MNLPMNVKGALLISVVIGGLAIGAVGAAFADGGADSAPQPAPPYQAPQTNARGQTYGSALGAMIYAQVPDLVSVWDNEGQLGYALKTDVFPSVSPSSPADAALPQQGDLATKSVPVYDADGVTVIGTYGGWGSGSVRTPSN